MAPSAELVAELAVAPLEAQLPLLARPQVLVLLQVVAQLPLLVRLQVLVLLAKDVVVRAQLLLLVQPALLAQAPREAAVAQEAVELHRSFSAAMAGTLRSPGPPTYAAVPRSWRKLKPRP